MAFRTAICCGSKIDKNSALGRNRVGTLANNLQDIHQRKRILGGMEKGGLVCCNNFGNFFFKTCEEYFQSIRPSTPRKIRVKRDQGLKDIMEIGRKAKAHAVRKSLGYQDSDCSVSDEIDQDLVKNKDFSQREIKAKQNRDGDDDGLQGILKNMRESSPVNFGKTLQVPAVGRLSEGARQTDWSRKSTGAPELRNARFGAEVQSPKHADAGKRLSGKLSSKGGLTPDRQSFSESASSVDVVMEQKKGIMKLTPKKITTNISSLDGSDGSIGLRNRPARKS